MEAAEEFVGLEVLGREPLVAGLAVELVEGRGADGFSGAVGGGEGQFDDAGVEVAHRGEDDAAGGRLRSAGRARWPGPGPSCLQGGPSRPGRGGWEPSSRRARRRIGPASRAAEATRCRCGRPCRRARFRFLQGSGGARSAWSTAVGSVLSGVGSPLVRTRWPTRICSIGMVLRVGAGGRGGRELGLRQVAGRGAEVALEAEEGGEGEEEGDRRWCGGWSGVDGDVTLCHPIDLNSLARFQEA